MRFHPIGAATVIAAALVAPASAQTTADSPASPARAADHGIRARLGLPDLARAEERPPVVLAAADRAPAVPPSRASRPLVVRAQDEPAPWPWGWTLRGLIGGALAGPVGTGVAFYMAGNSDVAAPAVGAGTAPADIDAAYVERIRSRRKEAAFVGGLVGTVAFLYAALVVLDIDGSGDAAITGAPRPPETGF